MLEVTSKSAETQLGVDFAQIYHGSTLYEYVHRLGHHFISHYIEENNEIT